MARIVLAGLAAHCCGLAPGASAEEQVGRARNKCLFVVTPPGPVQCDGRLDDWELSGPITATDRVGLNYRRKPEGFKAVVTIPRDVIGWTKAEPGRLAHMDVGHLFGNSTGNRCAQRAYWSNNSSTANIIDDIPANTA